MDFFVSLLTGFGYWFYGLPGNTPYIKDMGRTAHRCPLPTFLRMHVSPSPDI